MPSEKLATHGVYLLGIVAIICAVAVGIALLTGDTEKTTVSLKPVAGTTTTTTDTTTGPQPAPRGGSSATEASAPVTAVAPQTVNTDAGTLRTAALTMLGSTAAAAIGGIAGLLSLSRRSDGSGSRDSTPGAPTPT